MLVVLLFFSYLFFFFKQKTAYEMRISDWSSDVCSSDLQRAQPFLDVAQFGALGAQELSPRRHVVEQVANLDRGAARMRLRGHFTELAPIDLQAGAVRIVVAAR